MEEVALPVNGGNRTWVWEVGFSNEQGCGVDVAKVEQVNQLVEAGIRVVEGSRQCCL